MTDKLLHYFDEVAEDYYESKDLKTEIFKNDKDGKWYKTTEADQEHPVPIDINSFIASLA